jgi:hypothetical protein
MLPKPHSNRHASLTRNDIKRINNAFNDKCEQFDNLDLPALQEIKKNGYVYNGKKLTATYLRAFEFIFNSKQTNLTSNPKQNETQQQEQSELV